MIFDKPANKQEIATRYKLCLNRFKEEYLNDCPQCGYIEEEVALAEHRNTLRRTKLKVEDDYIQCDNPQKMGILESILTEIRKMLKHIENVLQHFQLIREYE